MQKSGMRVVMLVVCALCVTGAGVRVFADETAAITLKGGAIWSGRRADVTAVLTSTEKKGEYTVVYNFTWDGRNNTWQGEMKGSLEKGIMRGTGATPDGRRTFIFQARARRGVLVGKHYETTGGRTKLTGDIGLKRVKTTS